MIFGGLMSVVYYKKIQMHLKPKEEHQAAMDLLRHALSEKYPEILSGSSLPEIAPGSHGKPYFPDFPQVHFNISHCPGMIACAIDDQPVGVDAEYIRPFSGRIIRRVLTPSEQRALEEAGSDDQAKNTAFFRFWTLKESWVKQTGSGLSVSLNSISFDICTEKEKVRILSSEPDLYFFQWMIDGHMLSLCSLHPKAPEVRGF